MGVHWRLALPRSSRYIKLRSEGKLCNFKCNLHNGKKEEKCDKRVDGEEVKQRENGATLTGRDIKGSASVCASLVQQLKPRLLSA